MTATKKTSVVVADELTLLCEGIAAICEVSSHFYVAGHCSDGVAAVRMIESLDPEITVLDLDLPKLHGAAVIQKVRQSGSRAKLLVMSMRRDRKTVLEALRGGANGFLLKSDPAVCLVEAFHSVLAGSIYVSPQLELTEIFVARRPAPARAAFDTLSPREHQVFSLLVQGLRGKEIAARLDLSPKTVDTYRSSLMRKLEIYDVAGLVKFAIQRNLTSLG